MEDLFLSIVNLSITASYLALAVLVLRAVLKKAPKYLRCARWALVGIRLAGPVSIESSLSLIPSAQTIPRSFTDTAAPQIRSGVEQVDRVINPVLSEAMAAPAAATVTPARNLTALAAAVWCAGMAVMVLYAVISCLRLRRRVREAVPEDGVWLCARIGTPFILGFFRPRIYLPAALQPEDRPYVLAHEQAHLKRRDHWWKPLAFALLSVHWFNPLLWVCYLLLCGTLNWPATKK